MKRRNFLAASTAFAGLGLPALARGQAQPCPPPTVSAGGQPVTTSCEPPPPAGSAPAWFVAMQGRTWTRIATGAGSGSAGGKTLNQARYMPEPAGTSPAPNVTSYGGAGLDQARGELLVYGGGHGSYAGNEVYALSLRAERPEWRPLNAPSPGAFNHGAGSGQSNGSGQYRNDEGQNGAPEACHSSRLVFANDRLWNLAPWGMQSTALGTSSCFYFDRVALTWHRLPNKVISDAQFPGNYSITFAEGAPTFFVAEADEVWSSFNGMLGSGIPSLYKTNVRTNAITVYTNSQASGFWFAWAAPIGNRLVLLGSREIQYQGAGLYLFNAASPTSPYAPPRVNMNNTSGLSPTSNLLGACFHTPSNAVLIGDGDGDSFIKAAVPSNPLTGTWQLTRVTPANASDPNRVIPSNPTGYAYGRWNLINDMGNGQGAIVVLPDNGADKSVYVFKLPATGV